MIDAIQNFAATEPIAFFMAVVFTVLVVFMAIDVTLTRSPLE
jgi:hypothetical protein